MSILEIRFRPRRGKIRPVTHATDAVLYRPFLIENGRDAMASDEDVEMADADLMRFSTVQKGKGKATEPALPEEDDGLPWYVGSFAYMTDL